MLNAALTGNVAAGKSTVADWFSQWGATLIDSDMLVREVQRPGSPTLESIVSRFGRGILNSDGSLNRSSLRSRVLSNADELASLNAIVHPAVARLRAAQIDEAHARGDRIVVNDIPLLFEVLDPKEFDAVVLVEAPVSTRKKRLLERGLTEDEARRLIESQSPSQPKRARSRIVISNGGSLSDLEMRATEAWSELCELADSHLR